MRSLLCVRKALPQVKYHSHHTSEAGNGGNKVFDLVFSICFFLEHYCAAFRVFFVPFQRADDVYSTTGKLRKLRNHPVRRRQIFSVLGQQPLHIWQSLHSFQGRSILLIVVIAKRSNISDGQLTVCYVGYSIQWRHHPFL